MRSFVVDDTEGTEGELNNGTMMGFGKYRERTYRYVGVNDPIYCWWVRGQDDPCPQMAAFRRWLDANWQRLEDIRQRQYERDAEEDAFAAQQEILDGYSEEDEVETDEEEGDDCDDDNDNDTDHDENDAHQIETGDEDKDADNDSGSDDSNTKSNTKSKTKSEDVEREEDTVSRGTKRRANLDITEVSPTRNRTGEKEQRIHQCEVLE